MDYGHPLKITSCTLSVRYVKLLLARTSFHNSWMSAGTSSVLSAFILITSYRIKRRALFAINSLTSKITLHFVVSVNQHLVTVAMKKLVIIAVICTAMSAVATKMTMSLIALAVTLDVLLIVGHFIAGALTFVEATAEKIVIGGNEYITKNKNKNNIRNIFVYFSRVYIGSSKYLIDIL